MRGMELMPVRLIVAVIGLLATCLWDSGVALSPAAGSSKTSIDKVVSSGASCSAPDGRPFTPFGTWGITLP